MLVKKYFYTSISLILILGITFALIKFSQLEYMDRSNLENIEKESCWGELIPWSKARELFPVYVEAVLRDVETGKSFQVVRRGGTYHADIQPLTAQDSAILKEIYSGEWSWRRRAVIVQIGGQFLAGSIHGMPHGAGKIKNNDFGGHFCLHFLDSRVHTSKKVDLAHQMMVWKAAGRPEELFLKAEPKQLLMLVLTAINQRDGGLVSLGLYSSEGKDLFLALQTKLGNLPYGITLEEFTEIDKEFKKEFFKIFKVRISYYQPKYGNKEKVEGELSFSKQYGEDRWLIKAGELLHILKTD